jgi:hypothetical protein
MRQVPSLALALAALLIAAACRKDEQPAGPPAPAPAAPAAAAEEPVRPEAPAPASAPAPKAEPEPAAAEVRPAEPALPAEARVKATPAAPAAAAQPPPGEGAIYRWEDAQGVVHFGLAAEVPAARKASARLVSAGLSAVAAEPIALPPPSADPAGSSAVIAPAPPADKAGPGDLPERDEKGLPIPGTMKETAHTRAIKAATGGVGVDPAAVERQREEDNRRMNCRVVDGVTICG